MANKHFFKPLLPGFHSHLTIPEDFFLKYIEGRDEQNTAELRSDASEIIWKVKLDGERFTDGWKEFALAHDLRIGDIIIFRQERHLAFHVTPFGSSCCNLQYGSCLDEETNLQKQKKKVKKSPNGEAASSSQDPSCFVANVAPSSLRYDMMHLPRPFVRENGVVIGSGEIVLKNEKGKSWMLKIKQKPSCGSIYIRGGWRSFCDDNGLRVGDIFTFKLIQRRGTRVLRLLPKEPEEEEANDASLTAEPESHEDSNIGKKTKKNPRRETESSSLGPSYLVANIAPSSLRDDSFYLPKMFVRANGLDTRCGEMILMNIKGRSWTSDLKHKKSSGTSHIKRGWRSFCHANGLGARSIITFKLIKEGGTLVLRLTPNEAEEEEEEEEEEEDCSEANEVESLSTDQESEEESSQDERISQECSRRNEKKRRLTWKASSSPSEHRFVTLTLTPYNILRSVLRLPITFTRKNGISKETKLTLVDKDGVKWPTKLHLESDKNKRLRMVGGWKGFFQANSVKTNESIMLELIWEEEDTSCVLKFYSKV